MIKRSRFVYILALVAAGCAALPSGSEGPAVDPSLATEIVHEMSANVDFRSTAQMLSAQGQELLLQKASVRYTDDSEASGAYVTTIPVVNHQTGRADRYSWLSYEQTPGAAPVVALAASEGAEPGYEPQCYVGGSCGSSSSSSSSGGTSCVTLKSTDTCHLSGTWGGDYCVDGTKHWSYPRKTRQNYVNGQMVFAKDTIYSCGAAATVADANCSNACGLVE